MGLVLEAPISWDGSTAHDKVTRRDSPHASSFSPFHAFRARHLSRRLSHKQSKGAQEADAVSDYVAKSPSSNSVPAQRSILFTLPRHLREYIYSLVISPTGSTILHIILKYHLVSNERTVRFRPCRANPALDISCSSARCRSFLDTATGAYRGTFGSIINLLLISKDIEEEVSRFLYSHYEFDFDHPRAIRMFCNLISPQPSKRLRLMSFEPQYWFFTYKYKSMMVPEDKWAMTWQAVGQLQGLKRLKVRYKGASGTLPRNLEALDPRNYISGPENPMIDVQAPWIKQADALPAPESHLFRLPQSLREQIYEYVFESEKTRTMKIMSKRVLHNHDICTSLGFTDSSYYCCPKSSSFRPPGYEADADAREYIYPWFANGAGFIGMLRASKDINQEATALLYNRYEFVFDHPLSLIGFMNRLPSRPRDMIRRVRLEFGNGLFRDLFRGGDPAKIFGIDSDDMWKECWMALDFTKSLEELKIMFKTGGLPPKATGIDPRTAIGKRQRFKLFVVEAPWIVPEQWLDHGIEAIKPSIH